MNGFWAVFKRELKAYFTTSIAYVLFVLFLFIAGYLTFKNGFFKIRQADMTAFFASMPLLFLILMPAVAMRLWADERKSGSIEFLLTLPITVTQAVLGKFFASWVLWIIAMAMTFPMVITVYYLGQPDTRLIVSGYLSSILMAGGFLAVSCFFSTLSKSQLISYVLSVVACAVLVFMGLPTTMYYISTFLPMGLVTAIEQMNLQTHFESIQKGVLEFKDVSYFIILIVGWVAACAIVLEERKAG